MAAKNLYVVSDCLAELRRVVTTFGKPDGFSLNADQTAILAEMLGELVEHAKHQAWEISQHRWNALARDDRAGIETSAVAEELGRPQTNLTLFPIVPRPHPDGRQHDGRA